MGEADVNIELIWFYIYFCLSFESKTYFGFIHKWIVILYFTFFLLFKITTILVGPQLIEIIWHLIESLLIVHYYLVECAIKVMLFCSRNNVCKLFESLGNNAQNCKRLLQLTIFVQNYVQSHSMNGIRWYSNVKMVNRVIWTIDSSQSKHIVPFDLRWSVPTGKLHQFENIW